MEKAKCPVCEWEITDGGQSVRVKDQTVVVCCAECAEKVMESPANYVKAK